MYVPRPLPSPLDSRAFNLAEAAARDIGPGRLRAKDLEKPTRGVRLHSSLAADLVERVRAYQLAVPDAVVSHITAAIIWGFWLPLDLQRITLIHVSRPPKERALRREGAVGHNATLAEDDVIHGSRIVSTSAERTWCDLAAVLSLDELIIAGDFLVKRRGPLSSLAKLHTAVAQMRGRRGAKKAREALEWVRERTDSAKETELRLMLVRAGLPEPAINAPVQDPQGRFLEEPDMSYQEYKIAFQYDGGHHINEDQRRWDISRDERIIEIGWRVLKLTQLDLNEPPGGGESPAVTRTRRALSERGWKRPGSPNLCPGPSFRPRRTQIEKSITGTLKPASEQIPTAREPSEQIPTAREPSQQIPTVREGKRIGV